MKKIFVCISILSILTCNAHSQIKSNFGFKFGFVSSEQKWESTNGQNLDELYKAKEGMKIGIFYESNIYSHLWGLVEFNYAQKGSKYEFLITDQYGLKINYFDWVQKVDYLEVPLLIKYEINTEIITFYPILGIRFDYLVYRKAFSIANQKNLKNWIFGYTYGIGFEVKQPISIPFKFEFRHNPDITTMSKSESLELRNVTIEFIFCVSL